jgi:hypothetical protein
MGLNTAPDELNERASLLRNGCPASSKRNDVPLRVRKRWTAILQVPLRWTSGLNRSRWSQPLQVVSSTTPGGLKYRFDDRLAHHKEVKTAQKQGARDPGDR